MSNTAFVPVHFDFQRTVTDFQLFHKPIVELSQEQYQTELNAFGHAYYLIKDVNSPKSGDVIYVRGVNGHRYFKISV